jgi:hypothetical protein
MGFRFRRQARIPRRYGNHPRPRQRWQLSNEAASFELVARRAKARFVLGLSATVARKDGHHPIIFMQCGPVRYRVDAKQQRYMNRGVMVN